MHSVVIAAGRLAREERHHLQHVVLHHVADGASLLVELAAALDAEALGHRDLDVLHVAAVPDRLEERVREPEVEDVVDRFLAQVVVDAEDRALREHGVEDAIQLLGGCQVPSERLLDHDARAVGAPRLGELLAHGLEHARRDGEVVQRMARGAEHVAQRSEGGGVVVVAVDVAQQTEELAEGVGIDVLAGLLEAVLRARLQLIEGPAGLGDADDRHGRGCRAGPWSTAPGRSSCTRGRRWRRRRRARRTATGSMVSAFFSK